jgi:uncharacterized protein YbjT (DUF2867 family)
MMYASIRRHVVGEGSIDALMRRVDEQLAPALSQQPGFVCFFALGIDDVTIEAISMFRDQESAERSDEFAAACLRENFGEFELASEAMTGGEVLVSRAAWEALEDAQRLVAGSPRARPASTPDVSKRPVLVVGATGRTGRLIVDRLLERGVSVHALVRDRAKGGEMLRSGVRQFIGNVRSSHTLIAPMEGVGTVIIATAGGSDHANTAELVDYFGTLNLIRQAVASNVDLVVFVSTLGSTRPAHSMDVEPTSLGWKAMAEEIVRNSGVPYCIVRAGWLTDGAGGEPLSVSQGDTADGRISRTDLADVCTELLFLPTARGKTIDVFAAREGPVLGLEAAIAAATPDTAPESAGAA